MLPRLLLSAALSVLSMSALAAPPKNAVLLDHSAEALIDSPTAVRLMAEHIPAKVWKIYPASKWGFVSQVQGGLTASGSCVVTARVMMVPLTPTLKAVLFRPEKTATAFDVQAGASADQCRELARTKLQQAVDSVVSGLVKS